MKRSATCIFLCAALSLCGASCSDDGDSDKPDPIVIPGGGADAGSDAVTDAGHQAEDGGHSSADAGEKEDGGSSGHLDQSCDIQGGYATDVQAVESLRACIASGTVVGAEALRQVVADFMAAVESRGGLPVVDGGKATFVYFRHADFDDAPFDASRRNAPIQVAGDFNGWAPGASDAMEEIAPGLFIQTIDVPQAPGRVSYKFKARDAGGGDVWFADPRSRRIDYDDNGRISLVRGGSDKGHLAIHRAVAHSGAWAGTKVRTRDVWLYLPPGYDAGEAAYPVLYMHDGNNLFDVRQPRSSASTWDVDGVEEMELAAGNIVPHIVVAIPNTDDRMDEYTHVQDQDASGQIYGTADLMGGNGDAYADYVVHTVKPLVDRLYRTKPGFADTGILGSSLGGLISYYIALKYPETFKFVGGMSGTFGWGYYKGNATVIDLYGQVKDLKSRGQVYYLDAGGDYPEGGCRSQPYMGIYDNELCDVDLMKAALESYGIANYPEDADAFPVTPADADIYHYYQPGAHHNEAAWNSRLYRALRFFFPKR